jgi:hypothetical protein
VLPGTRRLASIVASVLFITFGCFASAAETDDDALAELATLPTSQPNAPVAETAPAPPAKPTAPAAIVAPDDDANAAIVELGEGREYLKPARGRLVVPTEEPGPPPTPIYGDTPQPGDPEVSRDPEDDDTPPVAARETPKAAPAKAVKAGDPERARVPADTDEPATVVAETAPLAPRAATVSPNDPEIARCAMTDEPDAPAPPKETPRPSDLAAATSRVDLPRFVSGDGLDSDAAEEVAGMELARRQARPPVAGAPPAAPPKEGDAKGPAGAVAEIATPPAPADAATSGAKAKGAEPLDEQKIGRAHV